jgi:hypothetical protein
VRESTLLIDTASRHSLTNDAMTARRGISGRAAWGSVAPRKVACRSAAREQASRRCKAIDPRSKKGSPSRCPFVDGRGLATLQKERSAEQPDAEA